MTAQRALLAVAVAAGLLAAGLYWSGAQRVAVAFASSDIAPGHAVAAADIEMRDLPPDAVPAGAVRDASAAIGRSPRGPVFKGQLLLSGALGSAPAAFDSGVGVPAGYHAVAIPVDASHALGGAILPGSRIDVIAVPAPGRAPAGRTAELVARAALVIDVRGEQGGPFERYAAKSGTGVRDRLGSVVIAVAPSTEVALADRIATSTFVLVLARDLP